MKGVNISSRALLVLARRASCDTIKIGGLVPFSTTDYPNHLSCVLFFQGCPLRCDYCHNKHLLPVNAPGTISWEEMQSFLSSRKNFLDAVVLSGGEPLVQRDLVTVAKTARAYGYKVALHTSGIYPRRFEKILPYIDWVGFDIKAPFNQYEWVTKAKGSGDKALLSLNALIASNVEHEVRLTLSPNLLSTNEILELAKQLKTMGVENFALQLARNEERLRYPDMPSITQPIINNIRNLFQCFTVRE